MIPNKVIEKMLIEEKIEYKLCEERIGHFNLYKNGKYMMSYWGISEKCHIPSTNFKGVVTLRKLVELYENEVNKMEFEKDTKEMQRENVELQNKINKELEKMMKETERADKLFKVMPLLVLGMLIVAIVAVINQIRIDNQILETYDSCVDINNERYCRLED